MNTQKITVEVTDRKGNISEVAYYVNDKKVPVISKVDENGKTSLALTDDGSRIPRNLFYGSLSPAEDDKEGKVAYCDYMMLRYQLDKEAVLHEPTEIEKAEMELDKMQAKLKAKMEKIKALKASREN